jgi:hypothetical protein
MQRLGTQAYPLDKYQSITVKVQSLSKTKRIREVPSNFEALKQSVEAQITGERDPNIQIPQGFRDFSIKYVDGDEELINVSDDEDLITAYEVANKELKGNLKFIIEMKKAPVRATIKEEP